MSGTESGAEIGAALPPNPAAAELQVVEASASQGSGLFGRGLLYVIVFSLQTVAATVVSPVLAHLIGPTEFGRLASAIALYQLLTVFAVLGLDQSIVLQRSEDADNRATRGLLFVSFGLITVVTLTVALTSPLWSEALGFGPVSSLLLATFLWTGPGAAVQVMLSMLLSEDRLRTFTIVSALSAVGGQVFGIVLLLTVRMDAATYAWGGVVSQFAAVAIGVVLTRPRIGGLVDREVAWRALKLGAPLAMGSLCAFVLNAGDRIVVQRILGAEAVGRYQVAYTVGYVVVLLLTFTSQAWTPRFAAIRDQAERLALAERSRNQLYRLLVPMILGITLGAPLALRIVAPASFDPDSLVLVVFLVALSAFPVAASGASGRELIVQRQGRSIAAATAAAAVANIGLNIVLVPIYGIEGSAAATVVAFSIAAVLQVVLLPREPAWPRTPVRLWLTIVAACALSAASTLLPSTDLWVYVRLGLAVMCLPWLLLRLRTARGAQ